MITSQSIGWIAGFIEGEGSFAWQNTTQISANQVQREPLERLQNLLGGNINYHKPKGRFNGIFTWVACGARARGIMMTIYSLMSPKRKAQISKVLGYWKASQPYITHSDEMVDNVVELYNLGKSVPEISRLISIPKTTIRAWTVGRVRPKHYTGNFPKLVN